MRKKSRGQKRKLEKLKQYLVVDTSVYPVYTGELSDHWHMPCAEEFLNNPKTNGKIKTAVMQLIIDRACFLEKNKPDSAKDDKIFAMINACDMWNSRIVLFYKAQSNEYYKKFFERQTNDELTPYNGHSLQKERNLNLPGGFEEKAYIWRVYDESGGICYKAILWFYGDFKD